MEVLTRKDGSKRYRERIYVNGKGIKSKLFTRKSDAVAWKARMLSERSKNIASGCNFRPQTRFDDFVAKWLKEKVSIRNSVRTQECYNSDIKNHLLPVLKGVELGQINQEHANQLIESLKTKGLYNRTVNKIVAVLKTILNDAVKWGYIAVNPLFALAELKENPKPISYWTKTEIAQFLRVNINRPLYPLWVVTINTGLRLGEVLGLCWDRVNFEQGQIEITRTMTRHGLQETTKTHEKRIVPINNVVKEELIKLFRQQKSSTYVFTKLDGKPWDYNHIGQRHFKKAQKEAGIVNIIRFHDLRHTFASQFMMSGGDIFTLQKILGHTSIKMTMRYAHFSNKYLENASNIVQFSGIMDNVISLEAVGGLYETVCLN